MNTPENVECQTCGGAGYCVDSLTFPPEQIGQPCPDCTPENVECQTCGGMVWVNRLDPHSSPISCPDCTPENVECSTCEGAGWDWKRCADEDLQVDDPVDYYWCQRCNGTGRVTPENVEEP